MTIPPARTPPWYTAKRVLLPAALLGPLVVSALVMLAILSVGNEGSPVYAFGVFLLLPAALAALVAGLGLLARTVESRLVVMGLAAFVSFLCWLITFVGSIAP